MSLTNCNSRRTKVVFLIIKKRDMFFWKITAENVIEDPRKLFCKAFSDKKNGGTPKYLCQKLNFNPYKVLILCIFKMTCFGTFVQGLSVINMDMKLRVPNLAILIQIDVFLCSIFFVDCQENYPFLTIIKRNTFFFRKKLLNHSFWKTGYFHGKSENFHFAH